MVDSPAPETDPKVVETHTATLFFVGDHVYKVKKSVDLGFLDHRGRAARQRACQSEVELNRRLAPDVYFGVLDVVGPDGTLVEHVVDMARMPDHLRLSRCIERGDDVEDALRAAARAVAGLHLQGTSDPVHDRSATRDAVQTRWMDGFDQVRGLSVNPVTERGMAEMEALATRFLAGREALFDDRIRRGWIRDGHGDLQAEDIFVLDDGPRILDCIEFGDEYRWGDVLSDVAFLAMDLERLGRPELGRAFIALHRELCADNSPATLVDHYVAYRAHVRAKVEIVRSAQRGSVDAPAAVAYMGLANAHLRSAQVQMILIGGEPGTGKSTMAALLGDRIGAVVVRTDEVRRRMTPVEGTDRYTPDAVVATYRQALAEARRLTGLGEHVIVDATWGSHEHREMARQVASEMFCDLTELRCVLPRDEADRRIRRRQREGVDPSEATVAVAAVLAARFDVWPEAIEVPTDGSPDEVSERAVAAFERQRERRNAGG